MATTPQASYPIEEISGTQYQTLEEFQEAIMDQLAMLLADIIRQSQEGSQLQSCDTIKVKLLEESDV